MQQKLLSGTMAAAPEISCRVFAVSVMVCEIPVVSGGPANWQGIRSREFADHRRFEGKSCRSTSVQITIHCFGSTNGRPISVYSK